jgi:hypothetical protein
MTVYFTLDWTWLLHLVWWAVLLSGGAALTTTTGFFVLRWLSHRFPVATSNVEKTGVAQAQQTPLAKNAVHDREKALRSEGEHDKRLEVSGASPEAQLLQAG